MNKKLWYRDRCTYQRIVAPNGRKFHAFWLPTCHIARVWAFYRRDMDGYPDMELSLARMYWDGWRPL